MKIKILSFIISLIIFSSCEKTIYMDIPDKGRKITLNSVLTLGEEARVILTKSKYIKDITTSPVFLKGASISILENGKEIGKFVEREIGYVCPNFYPEREKEYEIVANYDGLPSINAKTSVPKFINFESLKMDTIKGNDEFGDKKDKLEFKLTLIDPPQKGNYYIVNITTGYGGVLEEENHYEFSSNDPIVEYQDKELLFSDIAINNSKHTLIFETDMINYETFNVNLISVSKDLYYYLKSYKIYADSKDSPMTEPIKIHSNIKEGFGIFGGYSYSSWQFSSNSK